jgi:hypothetical protein
MLSPQEMKRHTEKARSGGSASTAEQEVRVRAYELYQQRGGEEGHETEDWLQAEREIAGEQGTRKAA